MSRAVYEQFRVQVKQEILQKLDCGLDFSDGQVRRLIDERLCRSDCIGRLDVVERRKLGRELFAAIRGFDVLQELLRTSGLRRSWSMGRIGFLSKRTAGLRSGRDGLKVLHGCWM